MILVLLIWVHVHVFLVISANSIEPVLIEFEAEGVIKAARCKVVKPELVVLAFFLKDVFAGTGL